MAAILSAVLESGASEHDGRARLVHRFFDARVFFRGERLLKRRQGRRIARLEHRLGGVEAPVRIRRHQRQRADRGIDHAAQPVVEANVIDIVGGGAFGRLAGRGIEQLVVLGLDVDLLLLGAEHQPRVPQRLDHGRGQGVAARHHGVDGIGGVAEIVGGKAGQRVFVGAGVGKTYGAGEQTDGEYERYDAIVENTHCSRSRHLM